MSIELLGVRKTYGRHVAVKGLDLSVRSGEVFAFLGPNGAGKTTTIKLICGLLRPDAGEIRVDGHAMPHDAEQARRVMAYVPDTPFVYPKLTGREFCEFVGRVFGLSAADIAAGIERWSVHFGLTDRLDELTEGYSHGMRQRVSLIAALLHEPRVLVIDEPMVGLDPRMRRTVKDTFRQLANEGRTVFVSTHTLDVAEDIADSLGIIHRGELRFVGTLAELQAAHGETQRRLEDVFLKLTLEESSAEAATEQPPDRSAAD